MIFKIENHDLEVNGIKFSAEVMIAVEEECDTRIEDDISFDDKEAEKLYIARFKRGELFIGCITVTARAYGLEGCDVLGACHLFSNNCFDSTAYERSVNETLSDYSMVENALTELKRNIKMQAADLQQFI
jgi:hypothetical protein